MSNMQLILTALILAVSVWLTRFLPFLLFGKREKLPPFMEYLGKVLPAAMMGLLVVYCFKDVSFASLQGALPALLGTAAVVGLHLWKRNSILSIAAGTAVYMLCLRLI